MNKVNQLFADLGAAFGRLAPRERVLVSIAVGALLLFAVFATSLSVSRSFASRRARIETKRGQLEEAAQLTSSFQQAQSRREELERRLRDGTGVRLFSHLEDTAKRHDLAIGGMTDKGSHTNEAKITESSVEVTFLRIPLDKLVKFLGDVERGGALVKVTRLQVRPRKDEAVIDAWLLVTTYQMAEG